MKLIELRDKLNELIDKHGDMDIKIASKFGSMDINEFDEFNISFVCGSPPIFPKSWKYLALIVEKHSQNDKERELGG